MELHFFLAEKDLVQQEPLAAALVAMQLHLLVMAVAAAAAELMAQAAQAAQEQCLAAVAAAVVLHGLAIHQALVERAVVPE